MKGPEPLHSLDFVCPHCSPEPPPGEGSSLNDEPACGRRIRRAHAVRIVGVDMPAITASMVAELRAKTDAPMMECKKALTEAEGDLSRAEEILRVKLGNK